MYYNEIKTGIFNGRTCVLTLFTFDKRKPWRRRMHLYDPEQPGEKGIFVGLEIFPPPKPLHNYLTYTRKDWSKSYRLYQYYDLGVTTHMIIPRL